MSEDGGGKIYFVRVGADGPIKIGFTSTTVEERAAALQTASPWPIKIIGFVEGNATRERMLHDQVADYRMCGEWFEPTKAVTDLMAAVLAGTFSWPASDGFGRVIEAFGGATLFSKAIGIPAGHAQTMKNRDSIPARYWHRVVAAAKVTDIGWVTIDRLAEMAEAAPLGDAS